jgi:hypothetical protein
MVTTEDAPVQRAVSGKRRADAKGGVTTAKAAAFADRSVAVLRDALSAGWGNWAELKEPEFDALPSQTDFQKLEAEVEAKVGPRAKPKN